MIERVRRLSYDWHGAKGHEPRAGSFLRSSTGRTYYVVSARPVTVKVSRGETCRLSLEVIVWRDAIPCALVPFPLFWNAR